MVIIVLTAFAAGLVIGVLGMVPRWWRHRSAAVLARKTLFDNKPLEKALQPPAHGL